MRRRATQGDSLELFLDTICNTFGGIIFIAILVAILSQTKGMVKNDTSDSEQTLTPSEVRDLKQRLAEAISKIESVEAAMSTISAEEVSPEALKYLAIRQEQIDLQKKIEVLEGDLPDLQTMIDEINQSNASLAKELQQVPKDLVALKDQVQQQLAEISDVLQEKQTLLKLPRETTTSRSSSLVLLKDGTVYWAGQLNTITDEFDGPGHVTIQKGLLGMKVQPVRGRGVGGNSSELKRLVNQTDALGNIVTLATWPDSHGVFQELKPILIDAGVKYQIWPMREKELVIHVSSDPNTRAQ